MNLGKRLFLLGFLVLAAGSFGFAQSNQWIHIHVEDAEKSEKVKINVPVSLLESMVPVIEQRGVRKGRIHIHDEGDLSVQELRNIWAEIRKQGDVEFISIENKDANIRVLKQGKYLLVQPEEDSRKKVDIRIPLEVVDAMLSGEGEDLNLMAALRALKDSGIREIISIQDEEKYVRIWVDESNKGLQR